MHSSTQGGSGMQTSLQTEVLRGRFQGRSSPWSRDRQHIHIQNTLLPGKRPTRPDVLPIWHVGMMALSESSLPVCSDLFHM
jgi:hypothetical protein